MYYSYVKSLRYPVFFWKISFFLEIGFSLNLERYINYRSRRTDYAKPNKNMVPRNSQRFVQQIPGAYRNFRNARIVSRESYQDDTKELLSTISKNVMGKDFSKFAG